MLQWKYQNYVSIGKPSHLNNDTNNGNGADLEKIRVTV